MKKATQTRIWIRKEDGFNRFEGSMSVKIINMQNYPNLWYNVGKIDRLHKFDD